MSDSQASWLIAGALLVVVVLCTWFVWWLFGQVFAVVSQIDEVDARSRENQRRIEELERAKGKTPGVMLDLATPSEGVTLSGELPDTCPK